MEASGPQGKLTRRTVEHAKHHRPAAEAGGQADREGTPGEGPDDAWLQQSHLILKNVHT